MQDKIQLFTFLNSSFLDVNISDVFQQANEIASLSALCQEVDPFIALKNSDSESYGQVKSIFSYLVQKTDDLYLPQTDLTIQEDNFPNAEDNSPNSLTNNPLTLQEAVKQVLSLPKKVDLATKLYYIFKQKAWCLKSEIGEAYLSEFEYLKSKTAFAVCLHHAQVANETTYPFLLFCADISGIQSFIYDIHSKKASKSLKGRSFYLQLLIDSLLERYIKATETTICNVIYSSGGKFFMLLPNTTSVKTVLDQLEKDITNELYKLHNDTLSIVTGAVPFRIDADYIIAVDDDILDKNDKEDEPIKNLRQLWKLTSEVTSKKKQTKLKLLFEDQFDIFFGGGLDIEFGEEDYVSCAVTGRPTKKRPNNQINKDDTDEEGKYVTPSVMQQIELGENLRDATFLNVVDQTAKNKFQPLPNLNSKMPPYDAYELSKKTGGFKSFLINPTTYTKGEPFFFYGGNLQALTVAGEIKTFEELTTPDSGYNFNKLGILRMDVDNLGNLFTGKTKNGELNVRHATFAAYSTLSAALDWFFSGYLNTLKNETIEIYQEDVRFKYRDTVNIIYAGGDDLFAVGKWDKLIDFAIDIRKKFRTYLGGDDRLTLSGGIAVVNNKFPLAKAATMAHEALEDAKSYFRKKKDKADKKPANKDAFNLFEVSVSWAKEHDEMAFVQTMAHFFNHYDMNRAFFYKLYQYKILKNANKMDWYWRSAYHIGRYMQRLKAEQKAEKEFLKAIQKAIVTNDFDYETIRFQSKEQEIGRMLDLICLASQLADYYKR